MFSLRAVQTTGRSLPRITTTTFRRILTHQASRVSPIAGRTNPSSATAATAITTQKRDIHSVVLPWPSTTPEPEIKPLDIKFLHQAAAATKDKSKVEVGDLHQATKDKVKAKDEDPQTTTKEQTIKNPPTTTDHNTNLTTLQNTIKEQSHKLLQQETDIQRLKTLVTQPGFCTQKKWVYECKGCGEVGVGVEMEGKGSGAGNKGDRMMELLASKEGERERWDVL